MEDIRGQKFRLKNEITGDIEETVYKVIYEEEDLEIPGLIWLYLESEYGDENVERETKFVNGHPVEIYFAKITNNAEDLLI